MYMCNNVMYIGIRLITYFCILYNKDMDEEMRANIYHLYNTLSQMPLALITYRDKSNHVLRE